LDHGFLPTRATFSMDILFISMFVIDIALVWSIWLVRSGRYQLHKRIQIAITCLLAVAVVVFEVDIRLINTDWRSLAELSPYYESGWVFRILSIHLCFAIPTPFIWGAVVFFAIRKFENPPRPNAYSKTHKRIGWVAACMMLATSITGCLFYWVAFVATK